MPVRNGFDIINQGVLNCRNLVRYAFKFPSSGNSYTAKIMLLASTFGVILCCKYAVEIQGIT